MGFPLANCDGEGQERLRHPTQEEGNAKGRPVSLCLADSCVHRRGQGLMGQVHEGHRGGSEGWGAHPGKEEGLLVP